MRIDHHGRIVRPKYVDLAADGRILKSSEEVIVEPAKGKLVQVDGKWKLSGSRPDPGPHA